MQANPNRVEDVELISLMDPNEDESRRYFMYIDVEKVGGERKITQGVWFSENMIIDRDLIQWKGTRTLHKFVAFMSKPFPFWLYLDTRDGFVHMIERTIWGQDMSVTEADYIASCDVKGIVVDMKGSKDSTGRQVVIVVSQHINKLGS